MNRTRFSDAMPLPPKMAQHYANLAKEGKATSQTSSIYTFIVGNQEITLVMLDPPEGYVCKAKRG